MNYNNTMKIKIDEVEYEVDIEKAKSQGLIKPVVPPAPSIQIGDVYEFPGATTRVVILQHQWVGPFDKIKYILGGNNDEIMRLYSTSPMTAKELVEYIQGHQLKYMGNVNRKLSFFDLTV